MVSLFIKWIKTTLEELQESLQSDIAYIRNDSSDRTMDARKINYLLSHLEAQKPNHDSLEVLFYYPFRGSVLLFNKSAFRLLEDRGIDIILNPELRKKIVNHYSYDNYIVEEMSKSAMIQLEEFRIYYQNHVGQKIGETFTGFTGRDYTKSYAHDYEALLSNIHFQNQLRWRIARKELEADRLGDIIFQKLELKRDIELELDRLL